MDIFIDLACLCVSVCVCLCVPYCSIMRSFVDANNTTAVSFSSFLFFLCQPCSPDVAVTASLVSQVEIADVFPPTADCHGAATCCTNLTIEAPSESATANPIWTEPTFSDERNVTFINRTSLSGSSFNITLPGAAPTEVRISAFDPSGNEGLCRFFVTVLDVTNPNCTCPRSRTYDLPSSATDGIYHADPASLVPTNMHDNSGVVRADVISPVFRVGATPIVQVVRDSSNNFVTCRYTITVQDLTPPVVSGCKNQIFTVTNRGTGEEITQPIALPTATDNSGNVTTQFLDETGHVVAVDSGQLHVTLSADVSTLVPLTFMATDASGLNTTCDFNITVRNVLTDPLSTSGSTSSSSSSLLPIIIGAVSGGAALIIVVIIVLYVRAARRRKMPHDFAGLLEQIYGTEVGM